MENKPKTMMIDDVKYIREDSIEKEVVLKPIKREDCPVMLVGNSIDTCDLERIVVQVFEDGRCLAVHVDYKKEFISAMHDVEFCYWSCYKPIPQTKTVPMTNLEAMEMYKKYPDMIIKHKETGIIWSGAALSTMIDLRVHLYSISGIQNGKIDDSEWKEFTKIVEE